MAGASVLAFAIAPAEAGKPRVKTTVTAQRDLQAGVYSGKVHSRKKACVRGRRVQVFHVVQDGLLFVGATRSDRRGRWEVDPPPNGLVATNVVKVKRKPKRRFVCRRARTVLAPPF